MFFLLLQLTACRKDTVYFHYKHTPLSGWEKNDTLIFQPPAMKQAGTYKEALGLRISEGYPFMGLNLIIEQTVLPSHEKRSDTLRCNVIDQQSNIQGQGVSQYQFLFPLTTINLKEGDKLYIAVRHDMKREILPGISDVGIRLTRE